MLLAQPHGASAAGDGLTHHVNQGPPGGLFGSGHHQQAREGGRLLLGHKSGRPSMVVLACAYRRRGIRPAWAARRPARTACAIASAMAAGSRALVTAEAMSTPSHPSSIARTAS